MYGGKIAAGLAALSAAALISACSSGEKIAYTDATFDTVGCSKDGLTIQFNNPGEPFPVKAQTPARPMGVHLSWFITVPSGESTMPLTWSSGSSQYVDDYPTCDEAIRYLNVLAQ